MGIAQFGAAILKFCPEQEWTYPKIQVALATQLYFYRQGTFWFV